MPRLIVAVGAAKHASASGHKASCTAFRFPSPARTVCPFSSRTTKPQDPLFSCAKGSIKTNAKEVQGATPQNTHGTTTSSALTLERHDASILTLHSVQGPIFRGPILPRYTRSTTTHKTAKHTHLQPKIDSVQDDTTQYTDSLTACFFSGAFQVLGLLHPFR